MPRPLPLTIETVMHYTVIAQDATEVGQVDNAPAVSMAAYLNKHDRLHLIPTISVYSERGKSRAEVRLLYMNAAALQLWKEMGMKPTEIGMRYRPPMSSTLAFGLPFSE